MEIFKLFGSILIKDEEALKKLDNIDKKGANTGNNFEKMTNKIGTGMQNVGKVMLGVGTVITATMAGLVKAGADWSAEVAGQQFLYKNLDKEVQKTIDSNAKYAESIGLTTQQYKNSATTMSTFYKNMGFATDETSKLSGETMNLVADLAAVTDMPFDEAMDRFKSGLMGNYEALDAFGINVSAASLENSEYVKSLGKTWNQLSDNEKMMAVYNEVTRQGASAQGLAKQEAESFGMKYKLLKQQIMETAGAIGEKLLPVLEPLIQKAVQVVQNIASWVEENPKLTQTILIVVGAFGLFTTIIGALLIPLGGLIIAVGSFNVAMLPTYGIILGVIAGIGLLIGAGVILWQNWDTVKSKANELVLKIKDSWNNICENISQAWNSIIQWTKDAWENVKNTITVAIMLVIEIIKASFILITLPWRMIWENCKNIIIPIWESIKQFLSNIWNSIKSSATQIWDNIKTNISNIINSIKNIISSVWNSISSTTSTIFNSIKNIASNIWNGIKSVISPVVNSIKSTISSAWNSISSTTSSAFNSIKNIASNVWNGIKSTISNAINGAKDTVKSAIDKMKGFFNFSWSLPKIKLPHISISGKFSLNPPSVPKFGIEWYKNGGIMTNPTMFGFNPMSGKAMVGGEAGPEAILPLSKIPELMKEMGYINDNNKTLNINLVMNGQVIANAIAPFTDIVNGKRIDLSERGLAL